MDRDSAGGRNDRLLVALCERCAERTILLILDQASIHKSRALKIWLAEHPQLELVYLLEFGGH